MTSDPFSQGGYTCAQCQQWVPYNTAHVCPGIIPVFPVPPNQVPFNLFPPTPAPMPAPQWDFSYKPTQREYFAARAMQGLLANLDGLRREGFKDCEIEQFAVIRADALIAALAANPLGVE
jgi:hypothetical protein